MWFLLVIALLAASVLGYLVYVQVRKLQYVQRYCEAYIQLISALYFQVNNMKDRLKEVDRLGSFKADDEVGFVFEEIDHMVEDLHTFITKYVNAEGKTKATEEKE